MNRSGPKSKRRWWDADFCSPKDLVRHAALILILFTVVHVCGLREHTSFLNGTRGTAGLDFETSAYLGAIYLLLYLASVLLVPVFLLAAALLATWQKLTAKRDQTVNECPG